jgi:hypothetical protein
MYFLSCLDAKTDGFDVFNRSSDHPSMYAVFKNQRFLSNVYILFKFVMIDYRERLPDATFDDLMNAFFKRLQFALKCWFLK